MELVSLRLLSEADEGAIVGKKSPASTRNDSWGFTILNKLFTL